MPRRHILEDEHLMTTTRDSFVEDNFEQALDAFSGCGWREILDGVSDKGYTAASQALHEAARKAHDEDNQARGKVLRLLAEACQ